MASDTDEPSSQRVNGTTNGTTPPPAQPNDPITPPGDDGPSSQSPPSTQAPGSPAKTEIMDEPSQGISVIASSLTPPPSSQVPANGAGALQSRLSPTPAFISSSRRDGASVSVAEYVPPTPQQVVEAAPEDLRAMVQAALAEHSHLKMEAAHHKLQHHLLSIQADEDAKRASVEQEMTNCQIEALRRHEQSQKARQDLQRSVDQAEAKYLELKAMYNERLMDIASLEMELKNCRRLLRLQENEIEDLKEERKLLLNRIRENREHMNLFRSPGGLLHNVAATPRQSQGASASQSQRTPLPTPGGAGQARDAAPPERNEIAALLQALSQEGASSPSTPIGGSKVHSHSTRTPTAARHTRNVQSMSSLPTTPLDRPRGEHAGLLPSVDLVPQTEPAWRFNKLPPLASVRQHHFGHYGRHSHQQDPYRHSHKRSKSRESTISAEDAETQQTAVTPHSSNVDIARQALAAAQASASRAPTASGGDRRSGSFHQPRSLTSTPTRHRGTAGSRPATGNASDSSDDDGIVESQASQAASEMLRRDPRESFEVASSAAGDDGVAASRDQTPQPSGKQATQTRLYGPADKMARLAEYAAASSSAAPHQSKRKLSGGGAADDHHSHHSSPPKKPRTSASAGAFALHPNEATAAARIGLGIRMT